MADRISSVAIWDALECDGGSQITTMPLPFSAIAQENLTGEFGGDEILDMVVDQTDASYASVIHERIIRLGFDDADVQEWRIREIDTARENDNARTAKLRLESIKFDLIHNSEMLERVEKNGQVKNHFELYGLTPTQHVDIILAAAPSYFTRGTIEDIEGSFVWGEGGTLIRERVDMIYHQDSPLSALQELALIAGLELEVERNGATDYLVNLYRQRGSGAATLAVSHASNLLRQRRVTDSASMGTQVYPRGGQDYGNEGSIENAWFSGTYSGGTLTFVDDLFTEDDQMNGYYIEDRAGGIHQITDTIAPDQVVLATAPQEESYGYAFRRAFTTGEGTVYGALTFIPSPAAIATYGLKPALLSRPDIPLIDNVANNPMLEESQWTGSVPDHFAAVAGAALSKNTDPLYTRHGGASARVQCSAAGDGIETDNIEVWPTKENPFITGQVQLYVVSGHVRLELIDVTNGVTYPPTAREAATISEDTWIDQFGIAPGGDPDDNFFTAGTQNVKLRLTQVGTDTCEFYLDFVQVTQTPSFTDVVYGGRASNDLFILGKEALDVLITPAAEYEVETIDENRLDGSGNPIVLGGDVQVTDTEMGINFTKRILSVTRDYLVEGLTQIEVEGKTNDLSRITARADRRIRKKLSDPQGDYEDPAQPTPEDPTGGGGGPGQCPNVGPSDAADPHRTPQGQGTVLGAPYEVISVEEAALFPGVDHISYCYQGKVGPGEGAGFYDRVSEDGKIGRLREGLLYRSDPSQPGGLSVGAGTFRRVEKDGRWAYEVEQSAEGIAWAVLNDPRLGLDSDGDVDPDGAQHGRYWMQARLQYEGTSSPKIGGDSVSLDTNHIGRRHAFVDDEEYHTTSPMIGFVDSPDTGLGYYYFYSSKRGFFSGQFASYIVRWDGGGGVLDIGSTVGNAALHTDVLHYGLEPLAGGPAMIAMVRGKIAWFLKDPIVDKDDGTYPSPYYPAIGLWNDGLTGALGTGGRDIGRAWFWNLIVTLDQRVRINSVGPSYPFGGSHYASIGESNDRAHSYQFEGSTDLIWAAWRTNIDSFYGVDGATKVGLGSYPEYKRTWPKNRVDIWDGPSWQGNTIVDTVNVEFDIYPGDILDYDSGGTLVEGGDLTNVEGRVILEFLDVNLNVISTHEPTGISNVAYQAGGLDNILVPVGTEYLRFTPKKTGTRDAWFESDNLQVNSGDLCCEFTAPGEDCCGDTTETGAGLDATVGIDEADTAQDPEGNVHVGRVYCAETDTFIEACDIGTVITDTASSAPNLVQNSNEERSTASAAGVQEGTAWPDIDLDDVGIAVGDKLSISVEGRTEV